MMKQFFAILLVVFLSTAGTIYAQQGPQYSSKVVVDGEYFYVHTVEQGETIFSISRLYGTTPGDIIRYNPHTEHSVRAGESIKIPAPEPENSARRGGLLNRNRRAETHTVNQGETAYSIARRYAITIDKMIEANPGIDPLKLNIGQKINIPKNQIGTSTQTETQEDFNQYTEALADITPGFGYHLVEQGQTLYSLSRSLAVPIDTLQKYNRQELANGLKFGSIIKYPTIDGHKPDEENPRDTAGVSHITNPASENTTQTDVFGHDATDSIGGVNYDRSVRPKEFNITRPLNVLLILPFTSENREEHNFVDFYNGVLIALEDLKQSGTSVNLTVRNSERSTHAIDRIFSETPIQNTDLIIGPAYEEQFQAASRYAYQLRIPIVSPLGTVNSANPFVFQVAPDPTYKYEKLKSFVSDENNIIFVTTGMQPDHELINEMNPILKGNITRINFTKGMSSSNFEKALKKDRNNTVIIASESESLVEEILVKLSSIQNHTLATTGSSYPLVTIGGSRWARFRALDRELYFKLGATFVMPYFADRTNTSISRFDQRYLTAFHTFPSLYSYRGYDVTKIFISALKEYGSNYQNAINRVNPNLLQVPYQFRRSYDGHWINDQWVLVRYRNDFLIDVK